VRALATIPGLHHSPDALKALVDRRLGELLPRPGDPGDLVALAIREAATGPGKRTRPVMMLAIGHELDAPTRGLLDAACAVEMVHAASLVLDDMPCMDNAQMRRGRPTIHRRFGEDIAALASIGLLSQAFALLAGLPEVQPETRNQLVALLACAIGPQGLVGGQCLDLREAPEQSADQVSNKNALKTGALFAAAFEMTAVVAQTDTQSRQSLRRLALELGQAFQLQDDLQDGDESTSSGKDSGQDAGKSTLISLLGIAHSREQMRQHVQRIETALADLFGASSPLLQYCRKLFKVP